MVVLANDIQSPERAIVRNVCTSSVQRLKARWQELGSPAICIRGIEKVVEGNLRRVIDQVEISGHGCRSAVGSQVVVEEGRADSTDVGAWGCVVDFGDGGDIARELYAVNISTTKTSKVSTHHNKP
jgi:hypothetical protein